MADKDTNPASTVDVADIFSKDPEDLATNDADIKKLIAYYRANRATWAAEGKKPKRTKKATTKVSDKKMGDIK